MLHPWLPIAAFWLWPLRIRSYICILHPRIWSLAPIHPLLLVKSLWKVFTYTWWREGVSLGGNVTLSCWEFIHAGESQPQLDRGECFLFVSQDQKEAFSLASVPEFFSLGHISSQPTIVSVSSHHLKFTSLVNRKSGGGRNLHLSPIAVLTPSSLFTSFSGYTLFVVVLFSGTFTGTSAETSMGLP